MQLPSIMSLSVQSLCRLAVLALTVCLTPHHLRAQSGAKTIHDLSTALGTTVRVLMIGAHPDDEDTQLLGWLARGAKADAAYLSLTRGDGGQNAIGTELGEALGVIRTEELLAARQRDGARQFFTRAYDFGFSKTAVETYKHWPRDSVFGDVVRIVRTFRPHIILGVFSGTPRDGHGHHQVSGILARDAYDASMDTVRFPARIFGAPWTAAKFYRVARGNAANGTLRIDVGVYDVIRGRSLAEVAGESRSQHRSQGFGVPQPRGMQANYVRREASRVNESTAPNSERSIFDGIDPSLSRFAATASPAQRVALDSLTGVLAALRSGIDLRAPWNALPQIDRARRLLDRWCTGGDPNRGAACRGEDDIPSSASATDADQLMSAARTFTTLQQLGGAASGLILDATVNREMVAEGDTASLSLRVTNRGPTVARVSVFTPTSATTPAPRDTIAPGDAYVASLPLPTYQRSAPWWLRRAPDSVLIGEGNAMLNATARNGDMFVEPASIIDDEARSARSQASVPALVNGIPVQLSAPIVYRRIDEIRGQLDTPVQFVPPVTLTIDGGQASYVRASAPFQRAVTVRVAAHAAVDGPVQLTVSIPAGLTVDGTQRTVMVAAGSEVAVPFVLRGTLRAGRHLLSATATASVRGKRMVFASGFQRVAYEHIRPQHMYRTAVVALEAVETAAAPTRPMAYIEGLADNVAPMLRQLGATVDVVAASALDAALLARYKVVVLGPRALEAQSSLAARMPMLQEWVRNGGTMIVQYQQNEIARPGMAPFPMTIARPANRVTEEDADVRILRPDSPLLTRPNRIDRADWNGWVQERATYMPATADSSYSPILAMHDLDEADNPNALLSAKVGKGTYIFTSLALFRQLPAGVPGAARLFVNLLNAGIESAPPRRRPIP
jgi:LmbE family N-acetylglucosaminyl deacetylase